MSTHPMLDVLLIIALKVTVLLGIAALLDLGVRRRVSAATRHMLWTFAVLSSLTLPILRATVPAMRVPVLPPTPTMRGEPTSMSPPLAAPTREGRVLPTISYEAAPAPESTNGVQSPAAPVTPHVFTWTRLIVLTYLSGVLLVLVSVAFDHLMLRRIIKNGRPVGDEQWMSLLRELADRSDVRSRVRLLRSERTVMPFTSGIVRPVIVIPVTAESWSREQREAVLLHELAHVARQDCLSQLLAAIACAVYWPHPLIWWAAARLRVEREHACDDLVLVRGMASTAYAKQLLSIARAISMPMPRLAVSMATTSDLEARLCAVIDDERRRTTPGRRSWVSTGAAALGLVALVAAIQPARAHASVVPIALGGETSRSPQHTERATLFSGEFTARLATPADGPENVRLVHIALRTPGLNTFYVEPSRLEGLTSGQFATNDAPIHFRLRRDAGTFDFSGTVRTGRAAGRFAFELAEDYNRELARRGIDSVTPAEQFSIARHDVTFAYIDELRKQGYATLRPADIVAAGQTGADLRYLREMDALGYRQRTLDALVRLWNDGVEPAYIRSLAEVGYRQLRAEDLIRLRTESIDAAFIRKANERARRTLSVDELVSYRYGAGTERDSAASSRASGESSSGSVAVQPLVDDTVVTGRWTIQSRPDGWLQLDIDWANVNQWKAFVRPSDLVGITRSEIAAGLTNASFRVLQDAGTFDFHGSFDRGAGAGEFSFTPNHDFAATLRALGVRGAERVGVHQLKNLAFGFMSANSVREFMAAGLAPLSLRELLDLAVFRVMPSYLLDMQAAGIQNVRSAETLVELKNTGVPSAYPRELAAVGYRNLTATQLIEMHGAGITPEFIRLQQAAGRADLSPEELVARKRERR